MRHRRFLLPGRRRPLRRLFQPDGLDLLDFGQLFLDHDARASTAERKHVVIVLLGEHEADA